MTIGKLAALARVSANTVRFYEREGLMRAPQRSESGYRLYGVEAAERLRFIRQAQRAGFTLAEIQSLVRLREDHSACCRDVKAKIIDKKRELEARIEEMKGMARSLGRLIAECDDDTRPVDNCPILAEIRDGQTAGHGSAWQRRAT